jgi:hypothetical protein
VKVRPGYFTIHVVLYKQYGVFLIIEKKKNQIILKGTAKCCLHRISLKEDGRLMLFIGRTLPRTGFEGAIYSMKTTSHIRSIISFIFFHSKITVYTLRKDCIVKQGGHCTGRYCCDCTVQRRALLWLYALYSTVHYVVESKQWRNVPINTAWLQFMIYTLRYTE